MKISILPAQLSDLNELLKLFTQTIQSTCKADYTVAQIAAWTSSTKDKDRWRQKIQTQYFIKAVYNDQIVGFGSLEYPDYIDLLYIHYKFQRNGVASLIFSTLEQKAVEQGARLLNTDASITAERFFQSRGFENIGKNTFVLQEVEISNFKMQKSL